jgi:hypothetical protein
VPERMTVIIQGSDDLTVEDAMRQVLDTFALVGRADPVGAGSIAWRLVSATTNSPFTVVAEARSNMPGINVGSIARAQKAQFRKCIAELRTGKVPAAWNSQDDRRRARNWLKRTSSSIAATLIETGDAEIGSRPMAEPIEITAQDAAIAEPALLLPPASGKPRDQIGSVEGYLTGVETHYHKPAIRIRDRRSGDALLIIVPEEFRLQISNEAGFEDVWKERRVVVSGRLHYDSAGRLERVTAAKIRALQPKIIDAGQLKDPDFTSGMSAVEYVEKLRDGDID